MRCFVAIELPDAVRQALAALTEGLGGTRPVPQDQLHLTLRFIGEADEAALDGLGAGFRSVQVEPFILAPEGAGIFPAKGPPKVLWIGVGSGHPRLFQLHQKVEAIINRAGWEPEMRRFHPHITLARTTGRASPEIISQWKKQHSDAVAPPFRVRSFALYTSSLSPHGAVHECRERFVLDE